MQQIPGLSLGESSLNSTNVIRSGKPSRDKPDWELRRLAFNFTKQTPTGPDPKQNKKCEAKPRQGKVRICHWGGEDVDARVRKLLTRNRTLKPVSKRENQKKVITQTKKPFGKFGRGDAPHEYWEEERRIREKKKSEKLAKKEKPKPEVRPVPTLTDEPSSDTEKGKVEILGKSSSLKSSSENEQKEKKQIDRGSTYTKDVSSYEVLDYPKFEVQPQVDDPPLTSRTESNLEVTSQMDLGSTYIKDKISNKVFHNSKSKVKTQREDPSLTSSSESEQEEEKQMDSKSSHIKAARLTKVFHHLKAKAICPTILTDSESDAEEEVLSRKEERNIVSMEPNSLKDVHVQSKYIKDWCSHKVFNKSRIQNSLQQPILSELENDSGSQLGDDDSEYEENENDESMKKTLKRGRGGAAPGEWQEMAEEERMKMVAIKRNKMVRIAQQVKM